MSAIEQVFAPIAEDLVITAVHQPQAYKRDAFVTVFDNGLLIELGVYRLRWRAFEQDDCPPIFVPLSARQARDMAVMRAGYRSELSAFVRNFFSKNLNTMGVEQ